MQSDKLSKEGLLALVIKGVNFAAIKHKDQRRKDANRTPYINHPLGVANILIEEGNVYNPAVILAAILHDTVEDTDTTFEEIEKEFGIEICNIVREVTDDNTLPSTERKRLQIVNMAKSSDDAKLVRLADKLYNLRDIERTVPVGWTPERVDEYIKWAKAVISGCRGINSNLEKELDAIFARKILPNEQKRCCANVVSLSVL